MQDYQQLLYDIEVHSFEGIKRYFHDGGDPNEIHQGTPLFITMLEMYTRTPRFKHCINAFIDAGLKFEDKALLAVFTDNGTALEELVSNDQRLTSTTCSLFNNTYTPLKGGTLLHFCAEFNSIDCAEVLVSYGADVNAKAGFDEHGFGGHTPIFHTVNQNTNNSADVMNFLLKSGADLHYTIKGLIWGKGYEWETFIPSVNAVSYAIMGLLPQMHREELTVAATVSLLVKYAYGIDYKPQNIPNAYLKP